MNVDPLLRPFESLLNRNVSASTPARQLLAGLAGRAFAIEVRVPPPLDGLRLRLVAEPMGLVLTSAEGAADATVAGTPLALLALLRGTPATLAGGGVSIAGDAEIAKKFEQLLRHARPDLEEELARVVGDVPAYQAARAARSLAAWGRRAVDTFARNVGEYLQEESRDVPARAELDHFLGEVDRLREDADRAEARLAALERRLRAGRDAP